MKEYYFDGKTVKFFRKDAGRCKVTRRRFSWLYSESARKAKHLPFRVENYYGPAFFYTALMGPRRNYKYGVDIIHRGIYRNLVSKGEY